MKHKSEELPQTRRLFVAIDLPQQIIKQLMEIQKILKQKEFFVGTYPIPENIHLTLSFIGEVRPSDVSHIEAALAAVQSASMEMHLGKLGIFMRSKTPKIVYVDVVCAELNTFAQTIQIAVTPWAQAENRGFISHVTLARVGELIDSNELMRFVETHEVAPTQFTVNSFVLKESILTAKGAVHRDVMKYDLIKHE